MSERIVFRSRANPELAYTFNSVYLDFSLRRNGDIVSDHGGQFYVYSDWPVQHSHEGAVPLQCAHDFLESLAAHLADKPDDVAIVAKGWPMPKQRLEKARFAATVKHVEGKHRFYSLSDEKVSSSESKRYDKRWEEIPEWANGTVKAVFGLVNRSGYGDLLERFQVAIDCVQAVKEAGGHPSYDAAESIVGIDYNTTSTLFSIISSRVHAFRLLDGAARSWECYQGNQARKAAAAVA